MSELQPTLFGRQGFQHTIKCLGDGDRAFDDLYTMNTQGSTQWDGLRHVCPPSSPSNRTVSKKKPALIKTPWLVLAPKKREFLQWRELPPSISPVTRISPFCQLKGTEILGPGATSRCGIHTWAQHGIVGRAVLLDFATYAEAHNIVIDHYENDKITYATLVEVGKSQGIDIRPESQGGDIKIGDVLLIRSGFLKKYRSIDTAERIEKHSRVQVFGPSNGQRYAGVEQSEEILDWCVESPSPLSSHTHEETNQLTRTRLHDCYFSAMAGDAPAFEAWPSHEGTPNIIHPSIARAFL